MSIEWLLTIAKDVAHLLYQYLGNKGWGKGSKNLFVIIIKLKLGDVRGMNNLYFCVRIIGKNDVDIGFSVFGDSVITRFVGANVVGFQNDSFEIVVDDFQVDESGLGDKIGGFGGAVLRTFKVLFEARFEIDGFTDIERFFVFVFEDIDAWLWRQGLPKQVRLRQKRKPEGFLAG